MESEMPTCDLMLFEHTGPCSDPKHREALRRRAAGAPKWSPISRLTDDGGTRDFLDGQAIHCGDMLELQAVEWQADDFGEFVLPLEIGKRVRYECNLSGRGTPVFYASLAGHEFTTRLEPYMRFRWPQ